MPLRGGERKGKEQLQTASLTSSEGDLLDDVHDLAGDAAEHGTNEVTLAVVATTLTVIAVFFF